MNIKLINDNENTPMPTTMGFTGLEAAKMILKAYQAYKDGPTVANAIKEVVALELDDNRIAFLLFHLGRIHGKTINAKSFNIDHEITFMLKYIADLKVAAN